MLLPKKRGGEGKGNRCKGMYRDMRNASSNMQRHKVNTEDKMRPQEQIALNVSAEDSRTKQTRHPNRALTPNPVKRKDHNSGMLWMLLRKLKQEPGDREGNEWSKNE